MAKANRKAHQKNNRFYDRKAKAWHFEKNDLMYFYAPAMKAGFTRKFKKFWSDPYNVIRKISELNYEIVSQANWKQIVHINRLKRCYNRSLWNPRPNQKTLKKPLKQKTRRLDSGESEKEGFPVGPFLLVTDKTTPRKWVYDPAYFNFGYLETEKRSKFKFSEQKTWTVGAVLVNRGSRL